MTLSHRLEKYLQDNVIPVDIDRYFPDGPDAMFCVFCGMEHDSMPFTSSDNGPEQNTFKCLDCHNAIENHLVRGQIELNFNVEKKRLQNLRDYSKLFFLPVDKFDYLEGGKKSDCCIFCENKPIGVPWDLEIPSGDSLHSYGGIVKVCDRCNDYLLSHNTTLTNHIGYTDTCTNCSNRYPIANHEYNSRCTLHTKGKHACPACFYKKYPGYRNLIDRPNCEVCGTELINDLTQFTDNPIEQYKPKIYCRICALSSHDPKNEVIIKHPIQDIYINVSTNGRGYAIYKVYKNKNEAQIISTVDDISKDHPPEVLAYKASKRVYELLKEGIIPLKNIQTKLIL